MILKVGGDNSGITLEIKLDDACETLGSWQMSYRVPHQYESQVFFTAASLQLLVLYSEDPHASVLVRMVPLGAMEPPCVAVCDDPDDTVGSPVMNS